MLFSNRACGCPLKNDFLKPALKCCSSNLKSCSSTSSSESESDAAYSCGCVSEESESEPLNISEIAANNMPYKEIQAIINNNCMVIRLQKELPEIEYDPPCDCCEPDTNQSDECPRHPTRQDVVFQKAYEGCKTISVYPHPDPKKHEAPKTDNFGLGALLKKRGQQVQPPTLDPEENPNIFVLKIKRKCRNGDKKHNLDLEFRAPRPWRQKLYCNTTEVEKEK